MKQQTKNMQTTTETLHASVVSTAVAADLRIAVLIVSVLLNLVVFTTWLALQVTTRYDDQLASFLFTR